MQFQPRPDGRGFSFAIRIASLHTLLKKLKEN